MKQNPKPEIKKYYFYENGVGSDNARPEELEGFIFRWGMLADDITKHILADCSFSHGDGEGVLSMVIEHPENEAFDLPIENGDLILIDDTELSSKYKVVTKHHINDFTKPRFK